MYFIDVDRIVFSTFVSCNPNLFFGLFGMALNLDQDVILKINIQILGEKKNVTDTQASLSRCNKLKLLFFNEKKKNIFYAYKNIAINMNVAINFHIVSKHTHAQTRNFILTIITNKNSNNDDGPYKK